MGELRAIKEEEMRKQIQQEEREAQLALQKYDESEERNRERVTEKKKVVKKKKKEDESTNSEDIPKLGLAVVDYNDVKSRFEKKKNQEIPEVTSPVKPLRINKLMNNPFLEPPKQEEKPLNREVKVNKLAKSSFIQQLEKRGSVAEDFQNPKTIKKETVKKDESKLKKISSDANIKLKV